MASEESREGLLGFLGSAKTALASVVAFITGLLFVIDTLRTAPLREENDRLKKETSEAAVTTATQSARIEDLEKLIQDLTEASAAPLLSQPAPGAAVYGSQVEFDWSYEAKEYGRPQGFVLELQALDEEKQLLRFPVLNPEQGSMTLKADWLEPGTEYFWRVVPGHLMTSSGEQRSIETGVPSLWGTFTLYADLLDKVVSTKELKIGTSPTIRGVMNFLNNKGEVCGMDVVLIDDFVDWLEENDPRFNVEDIDVVFVDVLWQELLPRLASRQVDLVISGMTRTLRGLAAQGHGGPEQDGVLLRSRCVGKHARGVFSSLG